MCCVSVVRFVFYLVLLPKFEEGENEKYRVAVVVLLSENWLRRKSRTTVTYPILQRHRGQCSVNLHLCMGA